MSPRPLLTVGLTGGIACGKSVVGGMLARLGAHVIEADAVVHALLRRGGAAAEHVIELFGEGVAAEDGSVDRAALARIVFADAAARSRLEGILHPRVSREIFQTILDLGLDDEGDSLVIADVPLLFETGSEKIFDRVVVVTCREETQVQRLMDTRGMTRDEALARLAAQAPVAEKEARADWVIRNDGSLEELGRRVAEVHAELVATFERQVEAGTLREPPGRRRF